MKFLSPRLFIAALCICGVVFALVVSLLSRQDPTTQAVASMSADLKQARERWLATPVDHYRLEMAVNSSLPLSSCTYDLEVRAEQIVQIFVNTCRPEETRTISALFQEIQTYIEMYGGKGCGPNGCECDGPNGIDAVYDERVGYPIEVTFGPAPRYAHLYSGAKFCTLMGYGLTQWKQIRFVVLP